MTFLDALHKITSTQLLLIKFLKENYAWVEDWNFLLDLPKHGELANNQIGIWRFIKHGKGIRFISEDLVIIDAHNNINDFPAAIDAWRIVQYYDSKKIKEIRFFEKRIKISETEINKLLSIYENFGILKAINRELKLFILTY